MPRRPASGTLRPLDSPEQGGSPHQTQPGNVLLAESATGLPKESVATVSQIVTLDKSDLTERAGKLPRAKLELVLSGVDVVLGR